ncbi:MAG TPA: cupin domain-containing protein [Gemmatimonadales bacterium]|nr:cupin domain-containing protein [Gemmatimonadales bacterium]
MTHPSGLVDRLAAFALGLPDADPDGALASHLAGECLSCATELRELRETVALLALGIQPLSSSDGLRERVVDRVSGESYAFVLSSTGDWREDSGLGIKQLYAAPGGGGTSLVSLRTGSRLADAYRAGDLGYVLLRGELDGEGLRLGTGDFVPAAGKIPGRELAVVMDTVLLAVTGSEQAAPLDSPRAVRSGKAAWNPAEPGALALPLAGSAEEGVELSLVRMEPGAALARHRHAWVEELCLISGDLRCQGVELGPEDYHRAGPGTTHDVATTVGGCTMVYIIRRKPPQA